MGKKAAKLFNNKNIIVLYQNNEKEFEKLNEKHSSSKSLNNECRGINNYINIYQSNLILDKVPNINNIDNSSLNKFNKKELIQEDTISFSIKSIYKNINIYTNMKYSQSTNLQEKTLSYLDKLIEKENKDSSFDMSPISKSKKKKIQNKETLSLSRSSNSSFKDYEELLNLKKKNCLDISKEKSCLKSEQIDNNILNSKIGQKKIISQKSQNNNVLKVNFSKFIQEEKNEIEEKEILSPNKNHSPKKKRQRYSQICSSKISLEDDNNGYYTTKNNAIKKKKKLKRKSKQLPKRRKNTLFEKFGFDLDINEFMPEIKPNIKEKCCRKKSITKIQNNSKHIKNKNIDANKSDQKSDKKIEKEGIKISDDYFAKEEKEECIII